MVTGILLMSNGTLVSYGYDTKYRLFHHNLETEQLIYSKEMKTTGAIEITCDGKTDSPAVRWVRKILSNRRCCPF